jgi:hypothetical protein
LLPSKTPLKIRFFRKSADFCVISTSDTAKFDIIISEADLQVEMVQMTEKADADLNRTLQTTPALYSLPNSMEITNRHIPKDTKNIVIDDLFSGKRLPSRVLLALVSEENYFGSLKYSPYYFPHFGLQEVGLTIGNGTGTYKMDWEKKHYMKLYAALATQLSV